MASTGRPGAGRSAAADSATHSAILDQLAEGVIVTDEYGRITLVNPAAERLHGVARLDVEPDNYTDTYHLYTEDGQTHPTDQLALTRAVRGEVVSSARWRIRRPDGTEILAIGDARPLHDGEGRQIGAVLTLRDDTAREAAERALRDLNATLAETVAARTRDAEMAQLEAERASAAKSEFLTSVSHELRTPLHSVLGHAELLSLAVASERRPAELVDRIREAGSALLGLVNDLLDLSRIEAGRLDLVSEPFSLRGLVEESLSMVREGASAKRLNLRLKLPDEVEDRFKGDGFRIRQVLVNLLSNAVKFTEEGGVTLELERKRDRLRFSVHDTGSGVCEADRHLLFQRFSQVDGTRTRSHAGTGLGLAICKRLVERLNGSIGMSDGPDGGSTFWFELELALADAPPLSPKAPERTFDLDRHVLLVDDVPVNLELGRMMLESAGHTVDVAASGEEAIAAVAVRAYDVVFMDVQMPGMDGLAATQRIRALDRGRGTVPIVALTADVLPQGVAAALTAGMDDHLGKPFTREAILVSVAKWTGGERHRLASEQRLEAREDR